MQPTPATASPHPVLRFFPGVGVVRGYQRAFLRPDLVAGLTVGAMLLPQAMAYAELAGMPPSAGFHAALLALVAYALLGSSRHLGVGPEPGTAILAATGVGVLAGGDPARYAALMATLAALVGALCLGAAVLRLGFLAAVLVGYITGVGLTLLSSQLGKATGISIGADGFFSRFAELLSRAIEIRPATLALSLGTLAVLMVLKRYVPRLPAALIGVSLATGISVAFDLPAHGVRSVGDITASLPTLGLPLLRWGDAASLLSTALGIALVGYTDNVLTARSVASRLGYRVDANQELIALGAINLCSSISGGFPISSSASRTAVPAALGSKTQLVGLVAAAFVASSVLGLGPLLSLMPDAALAAVILSAAIAIIDVAGLRRLYRVSKAELGIAVAGALAVMVFDVLDGVLIALAASVVLALGRIALPHDAILAHAKSLDGWVEADRYGLEPTEGLLVYRFDAPLFFANATRFRERVGATLEKNPGEEEWVVLDFEGIGDVDASALEMLGELTAELSGKGLIVAIARANGPVLERLERGELVEPRGKLRVFPTINGAVRAFQERRGKAPT